MRSHMLRTVSIAVAVGFCLAGVATAAEAPGDAPMSVEPSGCSAGGSMTLASFGLGDAVPTAGGEIVFGDATPCCFSDPCPATGQPVSCCADGCSAYTDRVWCSTTGWVVCPPDDPCKSDGSCNSTCGCSDPDCGACPQGASCFDDSDCDPCNKGFGVCEKDPPFAIEGSCSCFF